METTGFLLFLLPAVLLFLMLAPLGRGTRVHSISIAASSKAVWDTHFFHVGRRNYRQLIRFDNAEVLSQAPLTVRLTGKTDLGSFNVVTVYDLFEPYRRYRLHVAEQDGNIVDEHEKIIEDGEIQEEAGGTRLCITMRFPRRGIVLPWLARGRTDANLRNLKRVCEGGEPERTLKWRGWTYAFFATLVLVALWLGMN